MHPDTRTREQMDFASCDACAVDHGPYAFYPRCHEDAAWTVEYRGDGELWFLCASCATATAPILIAPGPGRQELDAILAQALDEQVYSVDATSDCHPEAGIRALYQRGGTLSLLCFACDDVLDSLPVAGGGS